jgi:predicted nucleic acid-binding protein
LQFVLDNSVSMRWALNDGALKDQRYADSILALLETHDDAQAVVPGLWWLEAASVLVSAERKGFITAEESEVFLGSIAELDIETDATNPLTVPELIIPIAKEYRLSVYDATYLALCLSRNIPLASLDRDLNRAAKRAHVSVLVSD